MTDNGLKELLDKLRSAAFYCGPEFSICDMAADEIERLTKRVGELEIRVELMKADAMGDDA